MSHLVNTVSGSLMLVQSLETATTNGYNIANRLKDPISTMKSAFLPIMRKCWDYTNMEAHMRADIRDQVDNYSFYDSLLKSSNLDNFEGSHKYLNS
jgi:hypothetical protein